MYIFGDNPNIPNSLEFLKNDTKPDGWVNNITTYSAWWIIDLIDYYLIIMIILMFVLISCNTDDKYECENGHDLKWTILQEPTCKTEGIKELLCINCHKVLESSSIDIISHKFEEYVDELNNRLLKCIICDYQIKENKIYSKEKIIPHIPNDNNILLG